MSFESYLRYPFTECTDALGTELFFAPPPQDPDAPSPESFDQELAGLNLDFPFEQFNFLPAFHDPIPDISTPPALTYSTDSATSHYSTSHYSSDFTEYSISSIQPLHLAEAQFNFGTSDLSNVGISPENLSIQPPTTQSVVPTPLPVHVTPEAEAQMAPASDRPYKCPHCSHCKAESFECMIGSLYSLASKRKHNLKTHIETHNKSKPFKCNVCGNRFSRKNDLHRHCKNPSMHRKQPSVSSISMRRSIPILTSLIPELQVAIRGSRHQPTQIPPCNSAWNRSTMTANTLIQANCCRGAVSCINCRTYQYTCPIHPLSDNPYSA